MPVQTIKGRNVSKEVVDWQVSFPQIPNIDDPVVMSGGYNTLSPGVELQELALLCGALRLSDGHWARSHRDVPEFDD